jgi:hypothetical protein
MRDDEVYSKVVKAGKRTYFFDVKSTRGKDLYITITESKKKTNEDGNANYEKHKLFLYKEDFSNFMDGLADALSKIDSINENSLKLKSSESHVELEKISSVQFEDLN